VGVVVLVAFSFAGFSGVEEFLVASCEDGSFLAGEFVGWGDVADRGVKPHGVVVIDETGDQATGVLEVQGDAWPVHSALSDFCQRSIFPLLCGQ
jgi:hypothetical protein